MTASAREEAQESSKAVKQWRFAACLLVSAPLFFVVNYFQFEIRPIICADCFLPHGIPFTYFREGGFAGGGGWAWIGILGELMAVIAFGFLLAWLISSLSSRFHLDLPR